MSMWIKKKKKSNQQFQLYSDSTSSSTPEQGMRVGWKRWFLWKRCEWRPLEWPKSCIKKSEGMWPGPPASCISMSHRPRWPKSYNTEVVLWALQDWQNWKDLKSCMLHKCHASSDKSWMVRLTAWLLVFLQWWEDPTQLRLIRLV